MEERTQTQPMTPKQPPTLHLGNRLKTARESLNLSEKDAALRLHLNIKYIHMMENDKYEGLPPTFVRGYLKSYAKLLNIPEREINTAYNDFENESKPLQPVAAAPTSNMLLKSKNSNTDRYIYWASYLIVIGMIALAGVWWNSHGKNSVIADISSDTTTDLTQTTDNTALKAPEGMAPKIQTVIPTAPAVVANPPTPPVAQAPVAIPAPSTPKTAEMAPPTPPVAQPAAPPTASATPPAAAPTDIHKDLLDMEMITPEPGLNTSDNGY